MALVGMGFGVEFVPIYQSRPLVPELVIADTDKDALESAATKFRVRRAYTSLEEVLADGGIDAVHLVTPVNLHASQSVQVLKNGLLVWEDGQLKIIFWHRPAKGGFISISGRRII